jgi:hypothetical protein
MNAIVKHGRQPFPYCVTGKKKWLEALLFETLNTGHEAEQRVSNGVLEAV